MCGVLIVLQSRFVYHETMDAEAQIAACIGEPVRARMLYCLLDGRARTGTELGLIGAVSPSTASAHLARLTRHGLLSVHAQGRHRYYRLADAQVASALEALSVVAGRHPGFTPSTPVNLRGARTCYDHMAGAVAVELHDRLLSLGWLQALAGSDGYGVSPSGAQGLLRFGIDAQGLNTLRRRLGYACLDWSERKPHIGGALGAALLQVALERKWVIRHHDERRLTVTARGRSALQIRSADPRG
jgi:DNA-binding transcriptional ArsR family regulator